MPSRLGYAAVDVLATATGLAAGHLVAAPNDPAASPVLAVGSTVIDLTPTPVKAWAVRSSGTHDKPILVGSLLAGALGLACLGGLLARRRFELGAGLLLLLVSVAGLAALLRPTATGTDVLPSVVSGVVGLGALAGLVRTHQPLAPRDHRSAPGSTAVRRRPLLAAAGRCWPLLAAAGRCWPPASSRATAMGGVGQWLVGVRTRPEDVVLPAAASSRRAVSRTGRPESRRSS